MQEGQQFEKVIAPLVLSGDFCGLLVGHCRNQDAELASFGMIQQDFSCVHKIITHVLSYFNILSELIGSFKSTMFYGFTYSPFNYALYLAFFPFTSSSTVRKNVMKHKLGDWF